MKEKTIAIILGGGRGTRLHPLTYHRSKPAVPVAGKYRLVDIPISNCLNSGIRKIFVLTQFNSASLNRHIKNTYNFDLFSHGFVDILAAEQTPKSSNWFQGTADAVRQSIHHLANHEYDYVLVLSGDQLYQMDYDKLIQDHKQQGANLTVATIPVTAEDASGFGIMKTNKDGQIDSFVEKPAPEELSKWSSETTPELKEEGKVYLASMGIYVFNKDDLNRLFEENPDATDFGKEIIPKAIDEGAKVNSYPFVGYWTDIGTISSFFDANIALTETLPKFNLFDNERQIYTRARLLPTSKLTGTSLEYVIVAEGCIIEASRIERSVIGIRSRIGKGTTIESSIVMGNDNFPTPVDLDMQSSEMPLMGIGQRCYISRAIVDKNVRIGNDVRIVGGSHLEDGEYDHYHVVDGIVIVPKGTVIPDGFTI
ncbi:glucose-1-phosphate adenylyltransferase [Rhodohalobacter barkolensis]|uniref:Glucose-1-phosphate adenylyltransferase n=1 Tax=Rhodohalobacter barkolensis TaxID=2053187 RepID=A0A2N0VJH0_9BACT|nr:glucose-1-phosphate adenylyltransferase [Rhodohalobacter barkolensis]PKD44298.1 glucose-1-phosphate adenylyltransferase [Rhodohalobacter barkolensis]